MGKLSCDIRDGAPFPSVPTLASTCRYGYRRPGLPITTVARYTNGMPTARSRRRGLKWVGLMLSVLIAMAWSASLRWRFWLSKTDAGQNARIVQIVAGSAFYIQMAHFQDPEGWSSRIELSPQRPSWGVSRTRFFGNSFVLRFSLWIPFVLIAIPTGFLWWRDRRRLRPGHCRCGYDLTGNTSGVCPECGTTIRQTGPPISTEV